MHSPKRFRSLALTSLLLVAASGSKAVEEDAFVASATLSTEEYAAVSQSGLEIVSHIQNARAAMDRSDWMRARFETAKARSILGGLREKSPRLRLRDRIAAALNNLKSGSKPKPQTLLPIYTELDASESSEDLADVREYVDKAKAGAAQGDAEVVEDSLVEASARLRYLSIDLPIEETYSSLTRALFQITDKNMLSAKATLRDAEQHIQTFVEIASAGAVEETSAVGTGPE